MTWVANATLVLDFYEKNNKTLPKKHSLPTRCVFCGAVVVCCLPCLSWSAFWRIIVCPCMCLCKGPGFACSNNGCTDGTDQLVFDMLKEKEATSMIDKLIIENENHDDVIFVLRRVKVLLEATKIYSSDNYNLCDALFMKTLGRLCSPKDVLNYIDKIIA